MKKTIIQIIVISLLWALPLSSYAAKYWGLKGNFVNVRTGPSLSSPILSKIDITGDDGKPIQGGSNASIFLELSRKGNWIQVKYEFEVPIKYLVRLKEMKVVEEIRRKGDVADVWLIGWARMDNLIESRLVSKKTTTQNRSSNKKVSSAPKSVSYRDIQDIKVDGTDAIGKIALIYLSFQEVSDGYAVFSDSSSNYVWIKYRNDQKAKIKDLISVSYYHYNVKFKVTGFYGSGDPEGALIDVSLD